MHAVKSFKNANRMNIIDLERIENEKREQQFLEERQLVNKLHNPSQTCKSESYQNSNDAQNNAVAGKDGSVMLKTESAKSEISLQSMFKDSKNVNVATNVPRMTVNSQTGNILKNKQVNSEPPPLKPSLVKRTPSKKAEIKSTKGSVRFKQGFDIIPDAIFDDIDKKNKADLNANTVQHSKETHPKANKNNNSSFLNNGGKYSTQTVDANSNKILDEKTIIKIKNEFPKCDNIGKTYGGALNNDNNQSDNVKLKNSTPSKIISSSAGIRAKNVPNSNAKTNSCASQVTRPMSSSVIKTRPESYCDTVENTPSHLKKNSYSVRSQDNNENKNILKGNAMRSPALKDTTPSKLDSDHTPVYTLPKKTGVQSSRLIVERELEEVRRRELEFKAEKQSHKVSSVQ